MNSTYQPQRSTASSQPLPQNRQAFSTVNRPAMPGVNSANPSASVSRPGLYQSVYGGQQTRPGISSMQGGGWFQQPNLMQSIGQTFQGSSGVPVQQQQPQTDYWNRQRARFGLGMDQTAMQFQRTRGGSFRDDRAMFDMLRRTKPYEPTPSYFYQ